MLNSQVNVVGHTAAVGDAVADLVPPDALRVRLGAVAVEGHGADAEGDAVRGPVAGGLEGEARVAAVDAALVAGVEVAVAADEAGGSRVEAYIR